MTRCVPTFCICFPASPSAATLRKMRISIPVTGGFSDLCVSNSLVALSGSCIRSGTRTMATTEGNTVSTGHVRSRQAVTACFASNGITVCC